MPETENIIPIVGNVPSTDIPRSTDSNNDQWYALATGALCALGIVAAGEITSTLNKDDGSK